MRPSHLEAPAIELLRSAIIATLIHERLRTCLLIFEAAKPGGRALRTVNLRSELYKTSLHGTP